MVSDKCEGTWFFDYIDKDVPDLQPRNADVFEYAQ